MGRQLGDCPPFVCAQGGGGSSFPTILAPTPGETSSAPCPARPAAGQQTPVGTEVSVQSWGEADTMGYGLLYLAGEGPAVRRVCQGAKLPVLLSPPFYPACFVFLGSRPWTRALGKHSL